MDRKRGIAELGNTKHGIFISHSIEESQVAHRIKELLKAAFGDDLKVFVSSDYESVGGGEKWFAKILENIKSCKVVLALISKESYSRPWVPYEAGVGEGAGATVIPLIHRDAAIRDLSPPISEYHVRNLRDTNSVLALIDDIGKEIGKRPSKKTAKSFLSRVGQLEMESSSDLTKPGPNVISTWFTFIINPLLTSLEKEQGALSGQKWGWSHLYNKSESIYDIVFYLWYESRPDLKGHPVAVSIDVAVDHRLEQFADYYPEIKKVMDAHDQKVKSLLEKCRSAYEAIRTSAHLGKIYKEIISSQSFRKREADLFRTFGISEADEHLALLAEYIVNHTDNLPSYNTTSWFWNQHKARFLEVLEQPRIRKQYSKVITAGEDLSQTTAHLISLLKKVRRELSAKYDVSY